MSKKSYHIRFLVDTRIMGATGPICIDVNKGATIVAHALDIQASESFPVPVSFFVCAGWYNWHVGSVDTPDHIWKPSDIVEIGLDFVDFLNRRESYELIHPFDQCGQKSMNGST